jgi:hypothetical protein
VGKRACGHKGNSKDVLNNFWEIGEFEMLFSEVEAGIGLDEGWGLVIFWKSL